MTLLRDLLANARSWSVIGDVAQEADVETAVGRGGHAGTRRVGQPGRDVDLVVTVATRAEERHRRVVGRTVSMSR